MAGTSPDTLIVYQAPWNWDFLWNRSQPLAAALAKTCTVVYVDSGPEAATTPWDRVLQRVPYVRRIAARRQRGRLEKTERGPLRFSWSAVLRNVSRANTRDWSAQGYRDLSGALAPLIKTHRRHWLLTSRVAARGMLQLHAWDRVLIDLEDPWFSLAWGPGLDRPAATEDLRRADVVFANGPRTAEEYQAHSGRPVHNLPNGIDTRLADALDGGELALPKGMATASPPRRAVFVGNINDRIDFSQFHEVAAGAEGWHFYFVGPESVGGAESEAWRALKARPNVTHLPPVEHREIPSYLHAADALLLPYSRMGGAAMFPAKLLEYVAAMKPVVSTVDFGGEWSSLPTVHTVNGAREFTAALQTIAQQNGRVDPGIAEVCRRIVRDNTWDQRAAQLVAAAKSARQ